MKVYSDDPVAIAREFSQAGARWIHVVDLSAAFGEDDGACAANMRAIRSICSIEGLSIDVGGGVRSLARIDQLAAAGASASPSAPSWSLNRVCRGRSAWIGELLVADVAARDGQVKVNGWRDGVGRSCDEVVSELARWDSNISCSPTSPATACRRHRCRCVSLGRQGGRISRSRLGRHLDA